jgi:acyl-CoA synthetase (NDP forming)
MFPVTPSHAEVEGLKAYASLGELPETPDLALVITPAHTVPDIIAECGARGIRNAIVYSSGFEEIESGKEHARRLIEAARQHNVAVLGPNCQGVWSIRQRSMLTFSSGPLSLEKLQHAPIAVISQSGALAGAIGIFLQTSGIGCSYIVSVGNETCLDALDCLGWVIEQDDVRVVALYIEGRAGSCASPSVRASGASRSSP